MNALNDRIKEQGGEVLGVNVGALDGDEQNIATAKQILKQRERNIGTSILILTAMPENLHWVSLRSRQRMSLTETAISWEKHLWAALTMTKISVHFRIPLMRFSQKMLKSKGNTAQSL